jgi:hypothetical protein
MNAATAVLAQKDTTVVFAMIQPMDLPFPRFVRDERLIPAEIGVAVPALGFDALHLFFRDIHSIFVAASAADMTVPVLEDWQMMNGERHEFIHK